ncbi:hypothetical protein [Aquimarina sp. I32.4]|uniref:hypothetical protein n=1 Tax=Aquimarina sp. I32.4 TaxID=2053903 RepID=UPI000CDE85C8|nr:hypothetical protein [Aquimarina sp. I32.4]
MNEILTYISKNNIHEGILVLIFTFGNFILAIILSILCYVIKPIKILYNTIGAISTGALMATFVNLLLLGVLVFFNLDRDIVFYSGIFISLSCYAFTYQFADNLWKIGKISER